MLWASLKRKSLHDGIAVFSHGGVLFHWVVLKEESTTTVSSLWCEWSRDNCSWERERERLLVVRRRRQGDVRVTLYSHWRQCFCCLCHYQLLLLLLLLLLLRRQGISVKLNLTLKMNQTILICLYLWPVCNISVLNLDTG